ncbi:response regulator transcription factor [Chitinophaga oryzae]|uniref:Response regulator transcription factor n=1 Tax=Chitinophaga oryzae TaxID=2725414 RepID=A0AAE7D696_9BACT|nr:LytTR family DNA-binding domain-containing protein [Chitinophaga oryzae]QJB30929.1 response regulator transcription factor [Chitinophaga oryzae]QJB37418.1 response regulator transcription factor [Chitinophaga oryzae]
MKIKAIAIDDEPLALELIRTYTAQFPALQLLQTFDDALSGAEFLRCRRVDLLFIDINMPDITGIDLVRSLEEKPMVIFTTAHKRFAHEGFELEALDYLLKPISLERFSRTMQKTMAQYHYRHTVAAPREPESFFVYAEYKQVRIWMDEVEYIESLEDYIRIHLLSGRPVLTLMPLKKVLEKLPHDRFRRIHRSYIVAVRSICAIAYRRVLLHSGISLPVSSTYAEDIREWSGK